MAPQDRSELLGRVERYLQAHHTMTIATSAAAGNAPHAAQVFYAVDDRLRLIFLSSPASLHAQHIGREAPVAVTVGEEYGEWQLIQGVQLWGRARLLKRAAKVKALALYVRRFPFVEDLLKDPPGASKLGKVGVYQVEPARAGFTDNTSGAFGRETVDLTGEYPG
jgi:uncharacterized protein YhbP (UPF0306 family)